MNEQNKKIIIAAVVVVLVIVVGVALVQRSRKGGINVSSPSVSAPGGNPAVSPTRGEAPSNVVVPNATSSNVPANVAKPSLVTPAAPGAAANYRSFSISISGNAYNPSNVIVNKGDTVHINFTAVDKNYDFFQPDYGLSTQILKGAAKIVEFQATAEGKFTFYCKSCGGPQSGPVGYLIVASK